MSQEAATADRIKSVNEMGRRPGDPSVALMRLISELQRKLPQNEILPVSRALFDEAEAFILAFKPRSTLICYPGRRDVIMLCQHWITPEPEFPKAA